MVPQNIQKIIFQNFQFFKLSSRQFNINYHYILITIIKVEVRKMKIILSNFFSNKNLQTRSR